MFIAKTRMRKHSRYRSLWDMLKLKDTNQLDKKTLFFLLRIVQNLGHQTSITKCFNARIHFSMNLKPFLFCIIFTTSFVQRFLTDVDLLPYVVCIQILVHVKIVDFVMLCDIPFENVRPEFIVLLSIKLLHSPCCHSASQTQKCSMLFLLV